MLASIPAAIPNFLENSPAATALRSAYVQHVVCSTIHCRIFQPFLFSLQRDHRKADVLLCKMSNEMRQKSIKKEAMWRQHTLHAAYTASDAKTITNAIAGDIVDEIVGQIESFVEPSQLDSIKTSVRRIVKVAAETWRYARLEREMITSEMGSVKDSKSDEDRQISKVLLHLMPTILRESRYVPVKAGEAPFEAVVFLRGKALYSDSPLILARLQELHPTSPIGIREAPVPRPQTPSSPVLSAIIDGHADQQNSLIYPPMHQNFLENEPRALAPTSVTEGSRMVSRPDEKADPNGTISRKSSRARSKSRPISLIGLTQPYDMARPAKPAPKRHSLLPVGKSLPSETPFTELDWGPEDQEGDPSRLRQRSTSTTLRGSRGSSTLVNDSISQSGPMELAESL